MNNDQLKLLLQTVLIIMGVVLFTLIVILIFITVKKVKEKQEENEIKKKVANKEKRQSVTDVYNKQSIFSFLEFDRIEDNMIIQKDKSKYLMIIECQGVNYDLMSGMEKVSVEQGFIQFLNTLRHPIQIYTQTRTVNLGSSVGTYKERLEEIGKSLNKMVSQYNQLINSNTKRISEEQINSLQFEITKQRNLYEYGQDIIKNTEKMSLNRNILRKYYYIVVPYYAEEIGKYDRDEIKGMAFSELYGNCQSMIQSLSAFGMNCKILNSKELVELLYVAYNRDESEDYELDKMLRSGYTELYTTAQDVLEKKMKELDEVIFERAKVLANSVIKEAALETKLEKEIKNKEKKIDTLVDEKAKEIVKANDTFLGEQLTQKSIDKIEAQKLKREGEKKNETNTQQKTRTATGKRK